MRRHENHTRSNTLKKTGPNCAQRPLYRIQCVGVNDVRDDIEERRLKNALSLTIEKDTYGESRVLLRDGFKNERVAVGNWMQCKDRNYLCQRRSPDSRLPC